MASKSATTQEPKGRVGKRRQMAHTKPGDGLLIKPQRAIDSDDLLTPEEAEIVLRGEAQLKRGESKPWRAVKHDLAG
jgi:hypothetical protein